MIHTIVLDGTPAMAFAVNDTESAAEFIHSTNPLAELRRTCRFWDGKLENLECRLASQAEEAQWQNARRKAVRDGDILPTEPSWAVYLIAFHSRASEN